MIRMDQLHHPFQECQPFLQLSQDILQDQYTLLQHQICIHHNLKTLRILHSRTQEQFHPIHPIQMHLEHRLILLFLPQIILRPIPRKPKKLLVASYGLKLSYT